jgi:murein L,D-transpeptidase YcbB/YkuD
MRPVPAILAARLLLCLSILFAVPMAALSQPVASAQTQDVADTIRDLLANPGTTNFSTPDSDANALRAFYGARLYQPAWTGSAAAQANTKLVLAAMEHADDDGLRPEAYRLGEIDLRRKDGTIKAVAEFELFLSDSVLRYARDLRQGRAALRDLDDDVGLVPDAFDPAADLQDALKAGKLGDFLAGLPPLHPEYRDLKAALAHYRARAEKSGTAADDARIARIAANMERWRWVPRAFGTRYVQVNTADATLEIVDHGNVVLTSHTVVGRPDARTPLFSADAVSVTANPSWHIPPDIMRHEILPKAHGSRGYLARRRIVGNSVDGYRQLPGRGNALGELKLEMPNEFDAYLHDTPSRAEFALDDRHLSHGCVRVEKIQPLTSYAMTGDVNSGLERIHALISKGGSRTIVLDNPLPVFVLYWTAIADADGAVNFLPDVYGRDQRLIAASAGQRLSSL